MKRVLPLMAAGLIALSLTAVAFWAGGPVSGGANPEDVNVVALGNEVYVRHCAGCHGEKLEGQTGLAGPQTQWPIASPASRSHGPYMASSRRPPVSHDQAWRETAPCPRGLRERHARLRWHSYRQGDMGGSVVHHEHLATEATRVPKAYRQRLQGPSQQR